MKLVVNRIVAEFNKIFAGTKRVGDSLRLEGKREYDLDVKNAATIGYKTESNLSVKKSVTSDKSSLLQSFDINGDPVVNNDGDPVYIKENQFRVSNSQFLRDVAPANLEVDIARRLKVGNLATSPIIDVASLVTHPTLYRVKDSGLLGGKTEATLDVRRAVDADNADLLNDTPQNQLVVEKARIATKLTTDDGQELSEANLRVSSAEFIRKGTENLNVYNLRDYLFGTTQAKAVYVNLSASSSTLVTSSGNKSFSDIMDFIKTDTSSEAYKAKRIIVASDNTEKTGDQLKDWIIAHNDFKTKVAALNALTSDRAVRFGTSDDNVTISEMDLRIKNTTVNLAANATKLQNNTPDDLFTTIRSRILSDASNAVTGLTQGEVDGFFGNSKVEAAIVDIKPTNAGNADTFETYTLSEVKTQIKNEGQVLSAKYIYANPITGVGQKSYLDITNDIATVKSDLLGTAITDYNTLGKIENIIKSNKTDIETKLSNEATTRTNNDNTLQSNIDIEKGRIDTIISGATFSTFATAKTYIDTVMGDLSTLNTSDTTDLVKAINTLEAEINTLEAATTSTSASVSGDVANVIVAVGTLSTANGKFDKNKVSGTNYLASPTPGSNLDLFKNLDTSLKIEESDRISGDALLLTKINDNSSLISAEETRAKTVEGDISTLTTSSVSNLTNAINSLKSELDTEATTRTNYDDALDAKISTNLTKINDETSRAKTVEGTLTLLKTTIKTSLVGAINENYDSLATEITNRTNADTTLQNNIDTLSGNLTTEASTRETNDNTLQSNINTVSGNLTTEITNRTNADTTLQNNINSEEANRKAADGNLSSLTTTAKDNLVAAINEIDAHTDTNTNTLTNVTTVLGYGDVSNGLNITGTNYIDVSNSDTLTILKTLDTQIKSNLDNADTRLNALGADITTLDTKVDNVESSVSSVALSALGAATKDMLGFEALNTSHFTWDDTTRVFTLVIDSPTVIWKHGVKYTLTEDVSVTFPNVSGGAYIKFEFPEGVPTLVVGIIDGHPNILNDLLCGFVYYDANTSKALIIGDERHGSSVDTQWHLSQHLDVGAIWRSGGTATYTLNDDTTIGISVDGIVIADEDLVHTIIHSNTPETLSYQQTLGGSGQNPAQIPTVYQIGSGWTQSTPSDTPWLKGTDRIAYNLNNSDVWELADVPAGKFVPYWLIATNDMQYPIKVVMGQGYFDTSDEAANATFEAAGFNLPEVVPMYMFILQTDDTFTNNDKLVQIETVYQLTGRQTSSTLKAFSASSHDKLTDKTIPNQHPIVAITGLEDSLNGKALASTYAENGVLSFNHNNLEFTDGTNKKVSFKIINDPLATDTGNNYEVMYFTGKRDSSGSTIPGNMVVNTYLDVKESIFTSGSILAPTLRSSSKIQIKDDTDTYRDLTYNSSTGLMVHNSSGESEVVVTEGNIAAYISATGTVTLQDLKDTNDRVSAITGAKSNEDTYVADTSATYLATATDLMNADTLLDSAVADLQIQITNNAGRLDTLEANPTITITDGVSVSDGTNTITQYDDSSVTGRLDTLEAKSITYTTTEITVIEDTENVGNPQLVYTISGSVITNADCLVFVDGVKLRKSDTIYTLTNDGTDTTLTFVDSTKVAIGNIIELEILNYA